MKMKKVLVTGMAVMMMSCVLSGAAMAEEDKLLIGLTMSNADEFTQKITVQYEQWAEENGVDVVITNANGDAGTQVSDMESLIAKKPDAIVARGIDTDTSDTLAIMANEAGIPIVFDEVAPATVEDYDAVVAGAQTLHGEIIGGYINTYLEENPDATLYLGYINGLTIELARERMYGLLDVCADNIESGRIVWDESVGDKCGNWSASEAAAITEAWLTSNPEINCIACANDEMALGVIEVLKEADMLDNFLVFGVDGTEAGQAAVRSGELNATTYLNTRISVPVIMETAVKLANGEEVEKTVDPKNVSLMSADTIDELLAE